MPQLWMNTEPDGPWESCALGEGAVTLTRAAVGLQVDAVSSASALGPCVVLSQVSLPEGARQWILIASRQSGVRVNGWPVALGLVVLQDRDEIRLPGLAPAFFSSERLAVVTPFGRTDRAILCPRCRDLIEPESSAVQCPDCGTWHHQSADRGCWTYAEFCAVCAQSTALDAGFQWRPEALGL